MTPYFSVVMPAYGVEKYIKRAIEHIQQQTFTDWELIIVDDAAKDKSGEIAEEVAKSDERICVIHHEVNRGLSPARNTGMKAATGKYIWFPDSDDWVEENLLEKVYQSLQENEAQLVLFGHHEEYFKPNGEFGYRHTVKPKQEGFYKSAEELRQIVVPLERDTLLGYAWNKIYDLAYLRSMKLQFEMITLIEDIVFNVHFIKDITRMNVLSMTPYHYEKKLEGSLTNKFVPEYYALHYRRIQMLYELLGYWHIDTRENLAILGSLYGRYLLSALQRNCDPQSKMSHIDRRRWLRNVYTDRMVRQIISVAMTNGSKSLSVALWMFRHHSVSMALCLGRVVYIAKNKLPLVYSKIKSER